MPRHQSITTATETDLVTRWLDNDADLYDTARGLVATAIEDGGDITDAADELRTWLEQDIDEIVTYALGIYGDLMRHAFEQVNWQRIAEHIERRSQEAERIGEPEPEPEPEPEQPPAK